MEITRHVHYAGACYGCGLYAHPHCKPAEKLRTVYLRRRPN